MAKRDLSLSTRKENTRDQRPQAKPLHFGLWEIKERFDLGITDINDSIDSAERMISNESKINGESILRAQVVFSEGLMDFYIHELSKYCLYQMFNGTWAKSEQYGSLKIPMFKVEQALATINSEDWFFEHVNDEYSRTVFLSCESMKDQLNLIGVPFAETVERAFPELDIKHARKLISALFARRNKIVHQNDRDHATAQQEDITPTFVREYVDKVEKLVSSMHSIAVEKDS